MNPSSSDPSTTKTVAIETHGCKLNQADSDLLARRFMDAGYRVVEPDHPADIYVVNSCTVTHVADSKARQALRSARRRNPGATIVATGCYAQRSPAILESLAGVDLVVGNTQKERLVQDVLEARRPDSVPAIVDRGQAATPFPLGRTRAMVKIQEGCDQVCAYCIVPRVRGRERSIPVETLLGQVLSRVDQGCVEVVLTGTQLGSYGFDLPYGNLPVLVQRVLSDTGLARLRVSSLQPQEISSELLALWQDPRLCPHFHLPLQSGNDNILRRMRRRYTTSDYAQTVERIRSQVPGASITADVIVGFPGESEDEHQDSLAFIRGLGLASLHVFPYSSRPGTSAAHLPDHIGPVIKGRRMAQMLTLARLQEQTFMDRAMGTTRPVLWEHTSPTHGPDTWVGLTDTYLRVLAQSQDNLANRITPATLLHRQGTEIYARIAGLTAPDSPRILP